MTTAQRIARDLVTWQWATGKLLRADNGEQAAVIPEQVILKIVAAHIRADSSSITELKLKTTESELHTAQQRISELEQQVQQINSVLEHHRFCEDCECSVQDYEGLLKNPHETKSY